MRTLVLLLLLVAAANAQRRLGNFSSLNPGFLRVLPLRAGHSDLIIRFDFMLRIDQQSHRSSFTGNPFEKAGLFYALDGARSMCCSA